MICPGCGSQIASDADFCGNCGRRLKIPDRLINPSPPEPIIPAEQEPIQPIDAEVKLLIDTPVESPKIINSLVEEVRPLISQTEISEGVYVTQETLTAFIEKQNQILSETQRLLIETINDTFKGALQSRSDLSTNMLEEVRPLIPQIKTGETSLESNLSASSNLHQQSNTNIPQSFNTQHTPPEIYHQPTNEYSNSSSSNLGWLKIIPFAALGLLLLSFLLDWLGADLWIGTAKITGFELMFGSNELISELSQEYSSVFWLIILLWVVLLCGIVTVLPKYNSRDSMAGALFWTIGGLVILTIIGFSISSINSDISGMTYGIASQVIELQSGYYVAWLGFLVSLVSRAVLWTSEKKAFEYATYNK